MCFYSSQRQGYTYATTKGTIQTWRYITQHKGKLDIKAWHQLLNTKESDQEEKKRKLFFGRLTDDITKDKVVDIIELVRPGASEWIEEQFPQVPPQVSGKSRTAFVQFTTHQTAREVKGDRQKYYKSNTNVCSESFKQLGEVNIQNINPEDSTKMTVLQVSDVNNSY